MAEWFKGSGMPFVGVANKCDKLSKSAVEPNLALIRDTLSLSDEVKIIAFSAEKGMGRGELLSEITACI